MPLSRGVSIAVTLALLLCSPLARPSATILDGQMSWNINWTAARALGWCDRECTEVELLLAHADVLQSGTLDIRARGRKFEGLGGGSLTFAGGPRFASYDLSRYRLRAGARDRHLEVVDVAGKAILDLSMGHFELDTDKGELRGAYFDIYPASDLQSNTVPPVWLGSVNIELSVGGLDTSKGEETQCSIPRWPGVDGAIADLEMIDIPRVSEVPFADSRSLGLVSISPAAVFRNAGTADLPWHQVFTTPARDPEFCLDAGDGTCEPYANDQQGLLVWSLYRVANGAIEQLAVSGVKHAFNSINFDCPCAGGRIVWQGCADEYSVSTNANPDFLGNRDSVLAQPVLFNRCGSVWDADCDQQCDNPRSGFVGCLASTPDDPRDRQLTVSEASLSVPAARYFVETWYLVRDDVDVFNSMGHVEVDPGINGSIWQFPRIGDFQNGPMILSDEFGARTQVIDTGQGRLALTTNRFPTQDNREQFQYAISNIDADIGVDWFAVPRIGAELEKFAFNDSNDNPEDDWIPELDPEWVTWRAPAGERLSWGTMVSFTFETEAPTAQGNLRIHLAGKPSADAVIVVDGRPAAAADVLEGSGFEGTLD